MGASTGPGSLGLRPPHGEGLRLASPPESAGVLGAPKGGLFPEDQPAPPASKPLLPYNDDGGRDGDPSHEPVCDGVWTVGVLDGVISTVEPSLIRGAHKRQDGKRQRGWGQGREASGHAVPPSYVPQHPSRGPGHCLGPLVSHLRTNLTLGRPLPP